MSDTCTCGGPCSCGAGGRGEEPLLPGDPVLFRHSAIRARLLAEVPRAVVEGRRPLAGLVTQAQGDPAIALVDAAAGAAHVLARTLGRLYDDGTLTRTQDPGALRLLTGLLGHVPRPAISAVTDLAVTVDDLADPAAVVTLPKGSKVASVPRPNEMPVTFETDAGLKAHAPWNRLLPLRAALAQPITATTAEVTVAGPAFPARPGDSVLIRLSDAASGWLLARVLAARAEPAVALTRLTLGGQKVLAAGTAFAATLSGQVILLGARAQAFGANAANLALMSDAFRATQKVNAGDALPTEWKNLVMDADGAANGWQVHLDAVYGDAAVDRAVLFDSTLVTGAPHLARISALRETARTDFGLSAKCTAITLDGLDLGATYNAAVRSTVILLETARAPLTTALEDGTLPATPDRITLAAEAALPPGRRVLLTGPSAADGITLTEAATVASATVAGGQTVLVFDGNLTGRWRGSGLVVLGNVVGATQGETPSSGEETLGAASPVRANPRYTLSRAPVAHVPAPGPRGYAPALEVRVNGRLYTATDSLWQTAGDARLYRLGIRPDGKAEVQFAARLPSGSVTALYRTGGGLSGNLGAGRLSMLMTPVPGIGKLANPAPASGGSDAETLEDTRAAAPAAIRTLDRAVSLDDYQAFAAGYRGVGKALASDLALGLRRVVCLTVADTMMQVPDAALITALGEAVAAKAPPGISLRIAGFQPLAVVCSVALASDPDLRRAAVEDAVRQALVAAFGPARRGFGAGLHLSQVLTVVQGVPGVLAAMVTGLSARTASGALTDADATGRLDCPGPRFLGDTLAPAGLLSFSAPDISFTEMAP